MGQFVSVGTQPESLILTPGERTLVASLRAAPPGWLRETEESTFDGHVAIGCTGTFGDLESPRLTAASSTPRSMRA